MTARVSVALDATALLTRARTGIGTYVHHLLGELAEFDDLDLSVGAFSLRGRAGLREVPERVRVVHRPMPARFVHQAWLHASQPSARVLLGRHAVVHGPNFVLPPPGSAAGVVTIHDLTFLHYPELVDAASLRYRQLVPKAVARAAAVLTPTRAIADEIIEAYRIPESIVEVTPLGVDPAWFTAPTSQPGDLPDRYLLAVGTLEPRKGLDVLIAAYRALLASAPDVAPLVLVGPPGWGPALEATGIPAERLVITGYLAEHQLRRVVAGAGALVVPSRYEGFGLPPLEALAAGSPVVASDVPALREVLAGHARLVPPGEVDALAGALSDVLSHPPDAEARTAAQVHAATFTWARCAQLTADVYRRVAAW